MSEKVELSPSQDYAPRVKKCLCHLLDDGNGGNAPVLAMIVNSDLNRVIFKCPNCHRKTHEEPNLLLAAIMWDCMIIDEWSAKRDEFGKKERK